MHGHSHFHPSQLSVGPVGPRQNFAPVLSRQLIKIFLKVSSFDGKKAEHSMTAVRAVYTALDGGAMFLRHFLKGMVRLGHEFQVVFEQILQD
jgi:hypothetical protein